MGLFVDMTKTELYKIWQTNHQ